MNHSIPVIDAVDIVVAGGTLAGVSAALAAARKDARVFLGTEKTYLGDDVCAGGRFWLPDDEDRSHPLIKGIFTDHKGTDVSSARPNDVKRRLEDALLDAAVSFLYNCCPADLLLDGNGDVAGVVFTGKYGPFAVQSKTVVDATTYGALARSAGLPMSEWSGGELTFKRVVAGDLNDNNGRTAHRVVLPGKFIDETTEETGGVDVGEYSIDIHLDGWTARELARAEQTVRDITWNPDQVWTSDTATVVPPVHVAGMAADPGLTVDNISASHFRTPWERFYVLGPSAAIPRPVAGELLKMPAAIAAGDLLGRHMADEVRGMSESAPDIQNLVPKNTGHKSEGNVVEPATGHRFHQQADLVVGQPAGTHLPVLGEYDVVVAGGGTGGAPAAIAAARNGAEVLVLESLFGLGGVGTLGLIGGYYHGNQQGFTGEITEGLKEMANANDCEFSPHGWNVEHKAEWLRKNIREDGGEIWFGTTVTGALVEGNAVKGVVVNTPLGRGLVKGAVVIDSSGNADVAAAAGAECKIVSEEELAVQGSGLPPNPLKKSYVNTDFTFIDDGDPVDVTRSFLTARRKFRDYFDLGQLPDTRERRRVVGDIEMTPYNVYMASTWHDTICLSRSNFDSHGFTTHPLFFIQPPDKTVYNVWVPFRAFLPAGIDGLLVTGLSMSAHRDVMPVLRMQADVQNHGYAAGWAAALSAVHEKCSLRDINMRGLQGKLVGENILPDAVLAFEDRLQAHPVSVEECAHGELHRHCELSVLMLNPDESAPLLRERLQVEQDTEKKVICAKLSAFLNDPAGEEVLIKTVEKNDWDEGWNYRGMGQFGRSMSFQDDCIVALACLKSQRASEALLRKASQLDATHAFSHFRAIALFAEALQEKKWADKLAELLNREGISGHSFQSCHEALSDIPASATDNSTRNKSLRELYLARAMYRCGDDAEETARRILEEYSSDIRGHYARHAGRILQQNAENLVE